MREEPAVREQVRDVNAVGSDGFLTHVWQPIAHMVHQAVVDGSQGAGHGGRLRQPAVLVKKRVLNPLSPNRRPPRPVEFTIGISK